MSVLVKHGSTLGVYLLGYRVYTGTRRIGVWLYCFGRDEFSERPTRDSTLGVLWIIGKRMRLAKT